ncbi:MAG: hypothetical protein ACLQF1_19265 [Methyloceanibacter sp.]
MSRGKKYTHASFAIRATFSTIDHNCPTISLACPRCNHHKAAALELFAAMDNWPTSQPFWRSAILQFDMSDRSLLDIELITLELQRTLQDAINGRRRVRQIGRRGGANLNLFKIDLMSKF